MSYDISFLPRAHGQSWDEALEAAEGRTALHGMTEERLEQCARIFAEVTSLLPRAPEQWLGEDGAELTDEETGLQVHVFPHEASVSFPYCEREDPESFHRLVAQVVAVVARHTGWSAYDPQSDSGFDGTLHDGVGLSAVRAIREHDASGAELTGQRPPLRPLLPATRTRYRRYLVAGAVVTPVSAVLLAVDPGPVAAVALVIGLVDLAVARRLWRRLGEG